MELEKELLSLDIPLYILQHQTLRNIASNLNNSRIIDNNHGALLCLDTFIPGLQHPPDATV